jgi:hypothetical protein
VELESLWRERLDRFERVLDEHDHTPADNHHSPHMEAHQS